ncbi:MAG: hypothetical protein KKF48_02195 [Nanoarchaeota archaeon]|nr:hypothetical protein [Nanoarchaeota archaeon]MBU1027830.1 hypothetical protein [Nanoarchaeota archaeon]
MTKIIPRDLIKHLEWKPGQATAPIVNPAVQSINTSQGVNFPDSPPESFLMSYDGPHADYFQELISKVNERFGGTRAEIPTGTSGEVQNMYAIKRMALVSAIVNNPSLQGQEFYPITPMQDEFLLKASKLPDPSKYWEDLALLLYDTNGNNPKEAQALKESIVQHRIDLGLSRNDLEKRLIIVGAGGEVDLSMPHGVKPIIIPGITQVYAHEILNRIGENHKFEYGLDRGLPTFSEIGNGTRTLYMPSGDDIGLRVLYRSRDLYLFAWGRDLASSYGNGRVNFARSASP